MPIDMNDPKMEGYLTIESFRDEDYDSSSRRIRDGSSERFKHRLSLHPATLVFPSTTVGQISAAQTLILVNTGYGTLDITGISVVGRFTLASAAVTRIRPGEVKEIQITFSPLHTGAVTGGVYINSGNAAGQEFIPLSGTGI